MRRRPLHVDDPVAVGRRLREARERRGLSQRALSFEGCSPAYISRLESGNRVPSLQLLRELGARLGVSADYLAVGRDGALADSLAEAELTHRLDEPEKAEEMYRQALSEATDDRTRARALAGLGQIVFERGQHQHAIELFEEAFAAWRPLEDEDASAADSLGRAYAHTSQYEAAIGLFERRLRAAEEKQDLLETVRFAVLLANALVDRGTFGRAEEVLGHALGLTADLGDPVVRARLWWSQSRLHTLQSHGALAERYARLALDTLLLTEHVRYAAFAHQVLAHMKLDRGEAADALELLDKGQPLVEEGGNAYEIALFTIERARAFVQLERPEEAARLAELGVEQMRDMSPVDTGRAYAIHGDAAEQLGDVSGAIDAYRRAADILPVSDRYRLEVHTKLAALLRREGQTEEAFELLRGAIQDSLEDRAAARSS